MRIPDVPRWCWTVVIWMYIITACGDAIGWLVGMSPHHPEPLWDSAIDSLAIAWALTYVRAAW